MNQDPPICRAGYDPKERRSPLDTSNKAMDMDAHCSEPASKSNARGAQNAPRTGAAYRAPVATYDLSTGKAAWTDQQPQQNVVYDGGAAQLYGEDSWKTLLLQPVM
jgi:phospholipid/cholesterol/gamma-HCH transport system substrate-binding protein